MHLKSLYKDTPWSQKCNSHNVFFSNKHYQAFVGLFEMKKKRAYSLLYSNGTNFVTPFVFCLHACLMSSIDFLYFTQLKVQKQAWSVRVKKKSVLQSVPCIKYYTTQLLVHPMNCMIKYEFSISPRSLYILYIIYYVDHPLYIIYFLGIKKLIFFFYFL